MDFDSEDGPATRGSGVGGDGGDDGGGVEDGFEGDGCDGSGALRGEQQAGESTIAEKIDCQHLQLRTDRTAGGKLYPHVMVADGNVVAVDETQELRSENLEMTMSPTTRGTVAGPIGGAMAPGAAGGCWEKGWLVIKGKTEGSDVDMASVGVDSLVATRDVKVTLRDGSGWLRRRTCTWTTWLGSGVCDFRGIIAEIEQGTNAIKGPLIEFFPDTNKGAVHGAGSLEAVQQAAGAGATRRSL